MRSRPSLFLFLLLLLLALLPGLQAQDRELDPQQDANRFSSLGSGERYAIIVGVSRYSASKTFPYLARPAKDAEALGVELRKAGFKTYVMTCQKDDESDRAIRANVLARLARVS